MKVAIVGAKGLNGQALLELIEERKFAVDEVYALDTGDNIGETALFKSKNLDVNDWAHFDFSQVDIAFFSDVPETEVELAVNAAKSGCVVITNQPAFRYAKDIPLVVAGVNDDALADYQNHNMIAISDATSMPVLKLLKPVYDAVGINNVELHSCQSVSTLGDAGVKELAGQTARLLNAMALEENTLFPQQMAFNVIPQIGESLDNGYSRDEAGQIHSIQKVMNDYAMTVDACNVLVPTFFGVSTDLSFTTQQGLNREQLVKLWKREGIKVVTDEVVSPVSHAAESAVVYLSRLRASVKEDNTWRVNIITDNVRVGGALNMLQVAEVLVESYL